ncbi:MAG: septum formation initiator family protein [Terriglobales bacterium]
MDLRVVSKSKARAFPTSEERLRSLVDRAPEAEAFAHRTLEKMRPQLSWLYEFRRRFATTAVILLTAWLFVHVVFGANGMAEYRQKKSEYVSLQKEIDRLQKENDQASHEIGALKTDPKAIEKQAREQLHYGKPGEIIFVVPTSQVATSPSTHTAQK